MEGEPAAVALSRYEAGEYDECEAALEALSKRSERNERVAFNRAVLDFRRRGFDAFRSSLRALRPNPEPEDVVSAADVPLFYSCALVLYRSCHFGRARALLERLLTFVSETEPALARDVALLAMEVALRCRLPSEATAIAAREAPLFASRAAPSPAADLFARLRLRAALMNRARVDDPGPDAPAAASTVEWLFLRAHRQHVDGDPRAAISTLARTPPDVGPDVRAALNGNLCALHAQLGKPNLAAEYARRALSDQRKVPPEDAAPEAGAICAFNLGSSLLKANRPDEAFDRLVEAVRHYPNNARIWLRLAECCALKRSAEERSAAGAAGARRVGSGTHAKLVVEAPERPSSARRPSGESNAIPTLSMEFAALCLTNATLLLPERERPETDPARVYRVNPCCPMNAAEYSELRREALLLYAHVSLALDDPATALECCAKIPPTTPDPRARALSHLYAAEALVALDRLDEALDRLGPAAIRGRTSELSPSSKDAVGFAVWLNAAVFSAIKGYAAAVQGPLRSVNSPRALPLQLYLETCTGNVENCRLLLRKFARSNSAR